MATTIIESLRTFIATYTGLTSGAVLSVDFIASPVHYSIVPMPGETVIESYITGKELREYPFAFQVSQSTADDATRIATNGFFEAFSDWLKSQTNEKILPTLPTGKTAKSIEALSHGYLNEQGESDTGIYQIVCRLTYEQ